MCVAEVLAQQLSGPDRRAVTERARVLINHLIDQRVDDTAAGAWPTRAGRVSEAR